ncbi:MAG TPA: YiiX/YebB-like N1pC/P60 family cysteine hydrolase [Pyrinomonadaceae bacterium]|jgi:hypothetical protein
MSNNEKQTKGWLERFLTVFGDLKVFRWPLFFLYDPGSYLVKGEDMRQVLELIQPGDVLVRGYVNYLDGYFIPGYFSHAGLYLGEVDRDKLGDGWTDEYAPLEKVKAECKSGKQMVIHAMAEGVFMEDLLNFCRCDYMAILRFPEQLTRNDTSPQILFNAAQSNSEERQIEERLERGETIYFKEVFPIIYKLALSQLGRAYDFRFNFESFDTFSCSELVYYCAKSVCWHLCLSPIEKRVLFIKKSMIEPDAFARCDKLQLVWHSKSVDQKVISEMRKGAAPAAATAVAPVA